MLVRPANFLILDEPTNHLDMRSQDILQQALMEYEGTLLIVSHNRDFLDPIISKTIEFRQGHDPRLFHGNLTYYLDKIEAEEKNNTVRKTTPKPTPQPEKKAEPTPTAAAKEVKKPAESNVNRKEQRKAEAAARQKLAPLQRDLEKLEEEIAEIESSQNKLSEHLSNPEVAADSEKFQETTHALTNLTDKLNKAYSKWDTFTAEIEALESKLS